MHGVNMIKHNIGAETFGVQAHALHQLRAKHTLVITRPVINIGGGHQLAALFDAGDQYRVEVGACRVNRGAVTSRA